MKRKKIGAYIFSVSALILLIVAAVFLPQIIFTVQDSYQTNQVDVLNRDVLDILALETSYSADVYTRLYKLAYSGIGNLTASAVESSIGLGEFNNIIEEVRNSEYMEHLVTMVPDTFGDSLEYINASDVKISDRYIIYGEDYRDGVILMFWYMKIYLPTVNSYMELIVDSETYTIYYVSVEAEEEVTYTLTVDDRVAVIQTDPETMEESLVYLTEEEVQKQTELEHSEKIDYVAENLPKVFSFYYCRYYGVYLDMHSLESGAFDFSSNIAQSENAFTMAYPLPYNSTGSKTLFFRMHAVAGVGQGPDISIGLPLIRNLIID